MDVHGQISLCGLRGGITEAVIFDLPQTAPVGLEFIKGVFPASLVHRLWRVCGTGG